MKEVVKTIKESIGRTIVEGNFFDRFYDIFVNSDPSVAPMFSHTNMEQQKGLLHHGLIQGLAYLDGKSTGKTVMERLQKSHGPSELDIPLELYDCWKNSLLQTVKDKDPKCDDAVLKAWDVFATEIVQIVSGQKSVSG
jgi:hemoglobin-like flavoprotein